MGNQQAIEQQHDAYADREAAQRYQEMRQYPEFIPYTRTLGEINFTERKYLEEWHKDEKYK